MIRKLAVILIVAFTCPFANAGMTGIGFGIHGGMVSGYNNLTLENSVKDAYRDITDFSLSKNMADVGFHINIGTLRIIDIEGSFDYGWKTQKVYQDISLTYSMLSATAGLKKSLLMGPVNPYVGIGAGLYKSAYSIDNGSVVVVLPDNETKTGYYAKGGVGFSFPMFPIKPFAEFKYNQVQTSGKATKYYQILAGLTFELP
jgi:opacity protein-like surface antigen